MSDIKIASTQVDVDNRDRKKDRPTYINEMFKKFVRWTDINDEEVIESLDYLSGDLYYELRKLTFQVCSQSERSLEKMVKKLNVLFKEDRELLKKVFEVINLEMEGEKQAMKRLIDNSWRDIVDKQKVGLDKICIVITRSRQQNGKEKEADNNK